MRLDHLLSREEVGVGLLSSCQGVHAAKAGQEQTSGLPEWMQMESRSHMASDRARGIRKDAESTGSRRMDGTETTQASGGDALTGHTRSHPEHDG